MAALGRVFRARSAGHVVSVSAIATDITARKEAELELERSHDELRGYAAKLEFGTQQLRRLASDLTLAEQRAREQLARPCTTTCSSCCSARLNVERAAESAVDFALLDEARSNLRDAIASARSLSVELFPPVLHQAISPNRWVAGRTRTADVRDQGGHASQSGRQSGCQRRPHAPSFESVRELLFNAAGHANVDRVSLDAYVDASGHLAITWSAITVSGSIRLRWRDRPRPDLAC